MKFIFMYKIQYKLDKICDVIHMSHLDNDTITQYTYFKYYYDFFITNKNCQINLLQREVNKVTRLLFMFNSNLNNLNSKCFYYGKEEKIFYLTVI